MQIMTATSYGPQKRYCRDFIIPSLMGIEGFSLAVIVLDGVDDEDGEYFHKNCPENWTIVELKQYPDLGDDRHRYKRLARVRNAARTVMLASECEYLYFHDADMVSPEFTINQLLMANNDIASGLYVQRGVQVPMVAATNDPLGKPGMVQLMDPRLLDLVQYSIPVAAVGMGCCLLSREVLAANEFRPGGQNSPGEDFEFCIRSVEGGFDKPVLVPSVSSWHFADDGIGTRIVVGDTTFSAVYMGDMDTVHNRYGVWYKGVPRFDLPANMELPSEFISGDGNRLGIETTTYVELFGQ